MSKTFNIYSDESCHIENDGKKYMFLAYISCAYPQVKVHSDAIKGLKSKHHVYGEIKWTKVSNSKKQFYLDLIDWFFATDMRFRTIGILKEKICCEKFHSNYDEFYYKMYYCLLNHRLNTEYKYNVYIDIKDTFSQDKVNKLKEVLNIQYEVFNTVQHIRSHESLLMQLADFIMGAISYHKNVEEKTNATKVAILKKISQHIDLDTTNRDDKLNLFYINLK